MVSVIIPAYKAEFTIRRAIDSVLAQTVPPDEIIVVDDGSPDNQNAAIEAYGDRVILLRQSNSKTAQARNLGIEHARGDILAFLDADDHWEPHKLERQLLVFEQNPEVGLVAGSFFESDPSMATSTGTVRLQEVALDRVERPSGRAAFRMATRIWTGVTIIRRQALGSERFVPGLEPAEDRDLWFRIAVRHPVSLIREPLATAVLEPASLSRSSAERDCSSMLKVVDRHRQQLGICGSLLWRSHTLYRWAALDPNASSALARLCLSFTLWPLPYTGFAESYPFGRTKRLIVLLRKFLDYRLVGRAACSASRS